MPLARMPVKTHGIKINLNGVGGLRTCIHLQEHRATNFAERLRRALLRLPGAGRQGPRAASPGAIVKGEHGLPVRAQLRQLVSRHRACGRHSGCGLWNMDARAGGATEAGAALEAIQGALTHTNKVTTLRYLRGRRTKKLSEIAEARNSKRAAENDGGTA
jgi:hypothetical protein